MSDYEELLDGLDCAAVTPPIGIDRVRQGKAAKAIRDQQAEIDRLKAHNHRLEQWILDDLRSRGMGDRSITGILDALERGAEVTT